MKKQTILLLLLIFTNVPMIFSQGENLGQAAQNFSDTIFLTKFTRYNNDVARFFAGLDQLEGSSIKNLNTNKIWLNHKKNFTEFWEKAEINKFPPIREFSQKELFMIHDSCKTLFYPFSGPDFHYANMFFPKMEKIIMFGLERIGNVPKIEELNDQRLDLFFKAVNITLGNIFNYGYFITSEMNTNFTRSMELKGVIPIIMIFMAKADYTILDVEKGTIDSQGEWVKSIAGRVDNDDWNDYYISGVRFKYMNKADKRVRTLYYFSHNVSDEFLRKTPEFFAFIKKQNIDVSYLKAAAYMCWYFETVRKFIVDNSKYVFQDDSGTPYKYYNSPIWERTFWGKYNRTLQVFSMFVQPELKTLYQTDKSVRPVNFPIGYNSTFGETNLMLFKKK